jgi:hypothetical protein
MSSAARRDEILYESDAALRLVDRAIQEMRVLRDAEDASDLGETVSVAAGDVSAESQELSAAD